MFWLVLMLPAFCGGCGYALVKWLLDDTNVEQPLLEARPVSPRSSSRACYVVVGDEQLVTPAALAKQTLTPAQWDRLAERCLSLLRIELATYRASAMVVIYSEEDPLATSFAVKSDLAPAVVQHLCQTYDAIEKKKNIRFLRPLDRSCCRPYAFPNN